MTDSDFPMEQVRQAYDRASRQYLERFRNELDWKPLDRQLLEDIVKNSPDDSIILDIGCGPGHVTEFLRAAGGMAIGVDLSPEMLRLATQQFPLCKFRVADFEQLPFASDTVGAIVAFYCIVHLPKGQLSSTFREMARVLQLGGQLLMSFHAGDEELLVEDFLQSGESLQFHFLPPDIVLQNLKDAGFEVLQSIIREAYPEEHPTRRCYITARRGPNPENRPVNA